MAFSLPSHVSDSVPSDLTQHVTDWHRLEQCVVFFLNIGLAPVAETKLVAEKGI